MQQWPNTDHKSRQSQGSQPRTAGATRQFCIVRKLQPNATSSTRDSDCRANPDSERSHLRRSVYVRATLHSSFFRVENLARANCTEDAQKKSTAWSCPRCAYSPYLRREGHFRLPKTFLPSNQRQGQRSQNFHSLATDGTLSPCSRPTKAFANAAVGVFKRIAKKSGLVWALVWASFSWLASQKSTPSLLLLSKSTAL